MEHEVFQVLLIEHLGARGKRKGPGFPGPGLSLCLHQLECTALREPVPLPNTEYGGVHC